MHPVSNKGKQCWSIQGDGSSTSSKVGLLDIKTWEKLAVYAASFHAEWETRMKVC